MLARRLSADSSCSSVLTAATCNIVFNQSPAVDVVGQAVIFVVVYEHGGHWLGPTDSSQALPGHVASSLKRYDLVDGITGSAEDAEQPVVSNSIRHLGRYPRHRGPLSFDWFS